MTWGGNLLRQHQKMAEKSLFVGTLIVLVGSMRLQAMVYMGGSVDLNLATGSS